MYVWRLWSTEIISFENNNNKFLISDRGYTKIIIIIIKILFKYIKAGKRVLFNQSKKYCL